MELDTNQTLGQCLLNLLEEQRNKWITKYNRTPTVMVLPQLEHTLLLAVRAAESPGAAKLNASTLADVINGITRFNDMTVYKYDGDKIIFSE